MSTRPDPPAREDEGGQGDARERGEAAVDGIRRGIEAARRGDEVPAEVVLAEIRPALGLSPQRR